MLRKYIIQKNISTSNIHETIGHNGSVFFKIFIVYLWVLSALVLLFLILNNYINWVYLKWCFAWAWFIALFKFCLDFFDVYLDSLVMVDSWIILYLWEWLLEYRTETFDWDKIETISFDQKWIRDKLFVKWNIKIRLEHGVEFLFENVSNPKKQSEKILKYKARFSTPDTEIQESCDSRNFDDLVESLWEAVRNYIDRNPVSNND